MDNNILNMFNKSTGYVGTSGKYTAINTAQIAEKFAAAGFELQKIQAGRVQDEAKAGYQKHLLVFRHPDLKLKGVSDAIPQIILRNSYDGSSAYHVMLGVYRMVCSNGLIVGRSWESVRVVHVGANAIDTAVTAALRVAGQAEDLAAKISTMQSVQLSTELQADFARQAAALILPEGATQQGVPQLLAARRTADVGTDLWRVFNRIQENVIAGGLSYTYLDANGRIRNNSKRAVKAIDKSVQLNRELWQIAESMLQKVG